MLLESIAYVKFILFSFVSFLFDILKFLLCRYTNLFGVLNSYPEFIYCSISNRTGELSVNSFTLSLFVRIEEIIAIFPLE